MNRKLIAALVLVTGYAMTPLTMAGDEELCLDCHEPAEDWEGMSAEEIMTEARAPGNKRHLDNEELSDEALQAAISALVGEAPAGAEAEKPCKK